MPVTQWFDDAVPQILAGDWRLVVADARDERRLRLADLQDAGDDRARAVLDCTGGWYAEQDWRGVRLDRLVAPGRRGFWWVKWVTEIRTDPGPPWAQPPFPLT